MEADDSKVYDELNYKVEPNEASVACHVSVVLFKMGQDAVLDLTAFAQMNDDKFGGIVRDKACEDANP